MAVVTAVALAEHPAAVAAALAAVVATVVGRLQSHQALVMLVVDPVVFGRPVRVLVVVAAQGRQALRSTQPQVVGGVTVFHPTLPAL